LFKFETKNPPNQIFSLIGVILFLSIQTFSKFKSKQQILNSNSFAFPFPNSDALFQTVETLLFQIERAERAFYWICLDGKHVA